MHEDQVVEAVDRVANSLFIFLLVFSGDKNVPETTYNESLAGTFALLRSLKQRKQLKRELLAAEREQLCYEDVRLKLIESM